jgi:hypothetical protein
MHRHEDRNSQTPVMRLEAVEIPGMLHYIPARIRNPQAEPRGKIAGTWLRGTIRGMRQVCVHEA